MSATGMTTDLWMLTWSAALCVLLFVPYVLLLSGNQGDRVSIQGYDLGRLLGYRWPV